MSHGHPKRLAAINVTVGWKQGSWIDWPAPRNVVAGESHYQEALVAIAGPICERGYCLPVEALLIREPSNPYDPNAIRVEVAHRKIGYVARAIAAQLADGLDEAGCSAFSVCGVVRGGSETARTLGVHLWLDRRVSLGPQIAFHDDEGVVAWPPNEGELDRSFE